MSKRKYNRVHCKTSVRNGRITTRVFINGVEAVKVRSFETSRPVTFSLSDNNIIVEDRAKAQPRDVTLTITNCLVTTEVTRR